jgi:hypothetical protein
MVLKGKMVMRRAGGSCSGPGGSQLVTAVVGVLFAAAGATLSAQVNVLSANYGNDRTNANLLETQLTPANVAAGSFGKIGSFPVDGQVYAQPL